MSSYWDMPMPQSDSNFYKPGYTQSIWQPSGQSGNMSPVSMGIQNQMGGGGGGSYGGYGSTQYGGNQMSPFGGYQSNYNFPAGQQQGGQMDPRYLQSLYAPQQLAQQQQQYYQTNISDAITRAKGQMTGMGIPAEGGLGDLEQWAQQKSALESEPIRKNKEQAMRGIEDQWARKGSALGSESERNRAEIEGASLAAMRSSSIAAAIDAFMKRPQILAQLMAANR
jgi:hypothetical protein